MSVAVRAFRHRIAAVGVPRVLVTPHLMGRTIGPVGDRVRQRAVVDRALELLVGAGGPATFDDMEGRPTG